jgi:hypothetical protein
LIDSSSVLRRRVQVYVRQLYPSIFDVLFKLMDFIDFRQLQEILRDPYLHSSDNGSIRDKEQPELVVVKPAEQEHQIQRIFL